MTPQNKPKKWTEGQRMAQHRKAGKLSRRKLAEASLETRLEDRMQKTPKGIIR